MHTLRCQVCSKTAGMIRTTRKLRPGTFGQMIKPKIVNFYNPPEGWGKRAINAGASLIYFCPGCAEAVSSGKVNILPDGNVQNPQGAA